MVNGGMVRNEQKSPSLSSDVKQRIKPNRNKAMDANAVAINPRFSYKMAEILYQYHSQNIRIAWPCLKCPVFFSFFQFDWPRFFDQWVNTMIGVPGTSGHCHRSFIPELTLCTGRLFVGLGVLSSLSTSDVMFIVVSVGESASDPVTE